MSLEPVGLPDNVREIVTDAGYRVTHYEGRNLWVIPNSMSNSIQLTVDGNDWWITVDLELLETQRIELLEIATEQLEEQIAELTKQLREKTDQPIMTDLKALGKCIGKWMLWHPFILLAMLTCLAHREVINWPNTAVEWIASHCLKCIAHQVLGTVLIWGERYDLDCLKKCANFDFWTKFQIKYSDTLNRVFEIVHWNVISYIWHFMQEMPKARDELVFGSYDTCIPGFVEFVNWCHLCPLCEVHEVDIAAIVIIVGAVLTLWISYTCVCMYRQCPTDGGLGVVKLVSSAFFQWILGFTATDALLYVRQHSEDVLRVYSYEELRNTTLIINFAAFGQLIHYHLTHFNTSALMIYMAIAVVVVFRPKSVLCLMFNVLDNIVTRFKYLVWVVVLFAYLATAKALPNNDIDLSTLPDEEVWGLIGVDYNLFSEFEAWDMNAPINTYTSAVDRKWQTGLFVFMVWMFYPNFSKRDSFVIVPFGLWMACQGFFFCTAHQIENVTNVWGVQWVNWIAKKLAGVNMQEYIANLMWVLMMIHAVLWMAAIKFLAWVGDNLEPVFARMLPAITESYVISHTQPQGRLLSPRAPHAAQVTQIAEVHVPGAGAESPRLDGSERIRSVTPVMPDHLRHKQD